MYIVIYLFQRRLKELQNRKNWSEHSLLLLSTFMFFLTAMKLSKNLNIMYPQGLAPEILYYISTLALIAPLFTLFIPTYTMKVNVMPTYLPIKKKIVFFNDFTLSLFNRPALSAISMTLGFFIYLKSGTLLTYLMLFFTLINSILLVEYINNLISWRKKFLNLVILPIILLLLLPELFAYKAIILIGCEVLLLAFLTPAVWLSFSHERTSDARSKTSGSKASVQSKFLLIKTVMFSKTTRTLILLYFISKMLVLFVLPLIPAFENTLKGSLIENPLQLMFFSPLLIFAYIYNNSFGYFRGLFLNIYLYNGRRSQFLYFYLRLLMPFLACDLVVSLTYLLTTNLLNWQNILMYLSITLFSIVISIASSCLAPRKIATDSLQGVRKNTSPIASIALLLPLIMISVIHVGETYYLIPVAFAISSLIALIIGAKTLSSNIAMKIIHTLK